MIWNWAPCTIWADIFSKWVDAFKYHWYSLMLLMFSGRIGRTDFPVMAHPPPNWCRHSKKGTQPGAAHSFFRFVARNMGHNELCQNGKWIVQWPGAACPLRLLLWRLRTNLIDAYRACICLYPNIWRHFIFLTMAETNAILIYFNPTAPQLTRQSDTVHEARNEGRGFGRFRRARHTALSANVKRGRSRCCGCRKHSKDWFYHVLEIKSMINNDNILEI